MSGIKLSLLLDIQILTTSNNQEQLQDTEDWWNFNLKQKITIPTSKNTKTFNHFFINLLENKVIISNALPCPILSDQDASNIITNIPGKKFQTILKYIKNNRRLDQKEYITSFKAHYCFLYLCFLIYSSDDSNEQVDTLNKLTYFSVDTHYWSRLNLLIHLFLGYSNYIPLNYNRNVLTIFI